MTSPWLATTSVRLDPKTADVRMDSSPAGLRLSFGSEAVSAPFTNSATNVLADVGTIKPTSGQRLGAPLTGLDTPTLCGTWQTAPYLHDGSAVSLADAVSAHTNVSLSAGDLALVAAYVREIDATTAPDCTPPIPSSPGSPVRVTLMARMSAIRSSRLLRESSPSTTSTRDGVM